MKILLTRPIEDSQRIANDLKELNIKSVISPLLEIHRKRDEEIDYNKYQLPVSWVIYLTYIMIEKV